MHGIQLADISLRGVLEFRHLSRRWYPERNLTLSLVVHSADMETDGVILIEAKVDLEQDVDKVCLPATEAFSAAINSNIGTLSWSEVREQDLGLGMPPESHRSTCQCHEAWTKNNH